MFARNFLKNNSRWQQLFKGACAKFQRVPVPASSQGLQLQFSTNNADKRKIITKQNGETIIHSPYPDIVEDNRSFGEFMFSFLEEYQNYEMIVSLLISTDYC